MAWFRGGGIDHHLGKRSIFAIEPFSCPFSVREWHDSHCGVFLPDAAPRRTVGMMPSWSDLDPA